MGVHLPGRHGLPARRERERRSRPSRRARLPSTLFRGVGDGGGAQGLSSAFRAGRDTSSLGRSGAGRGGGGGALRAQIFLCPRGGRGAFPLLRRGQRQCPWLRLPPSPSNHGAVGAVAPVTGRLVSERISKVGICVCVCVRWGKGTLPISQNWLCFCRVVWEEEGTVVTVGVSELPWAVRRCEGFRRCSLKTDLPALGLVFLRGGQSGWEAAAW